MNRNERPGVDVRGWLGLVIGIGVMWFVLVVHPLWDYFESHGTHLAQFVGCLLMTVIVWMAHVWKQSRSWEDYGDEVRQWQADHDIRFAEQLFRMTYGKAIELQNFMLGQNDGGEGEEVIGG